jgi:hypothetical protein
MTDKKTDAQAGDDDVEGHSQARGPEGAQARGPEGNRARITGDDDDVEGHSYRSGSTKGE